MSVEPHDWLLARPEQTAKGLLESLQDKYPDVYPAHLLRTLQRRVLIWRADMVIAFDDHLASADILVPPTLPGPLRGTDFKANPERALATG